MKKLFFLTLLSLFGFSSCNPDESLSPLPVKKSGQFMKLEITNKELLSTDLSNSTFGGILTDVSGNVIKYDLYVRRTNSLGIVTGDYVILQSINSFPYQLSITPAQLADALGVNVSDFKKGDVFRFLGYSYDSNGIKAGYTSLSRIIQTTLTLQQGYKFNTDINDVFDPEYINRQDIN
jgi:hypothetical protein